MRLKIHIIFVILLLILGLSFPTIIQAKEKKCPRGVPFKLLLNKINALTERVEALEDQIDGSLLIEIVVSDNFIHLGDDQPTWETTVHIQQDELSRSRYAAVEFVAVNVWEGTSDNLIVNACIPQAMLHEYEMPPVVFAYQDSNIFDHTCRLPFRQVFSLTAPPQRCPLYPIVPTHAKCSRGRTAILFIHPATRRMNWEHDGGLRYLRARRGRDCSGRNWGWPSRGSRRPRCP